MGDGMGSAGSVESIAWTRWRPSPACCSRHSFVRHSRRPPPCCRWPSAESQPPRVKSWWFLVQVARKQLRQARTRPRTPQWPFPSGVLICGRPHIVAVAGEDDREDVLVICWEHGDERLDAVI